MTDKLDNISACVFDAYGTLFDVNAAAAHCATIWATIGCRWPRFGAPSNCNTPGFGP